MEDIDRDEFLKRLDYLFDPLMESDFKECIKALVNADSVYIDALKAKYVSFASEKNRYIDAYDAAPDQDARDAIIGSVTLNNVL